VGDASTALLRIFGAGNKQVCLWKHVIKRRPIMLYAIGYDYFPIAYTSSKSLGFKKFVGNIVNKYPFIDISFDILYIIRYLF